MAKPMYKVSYSFAVRGYATGKMHVPAKLWGDKDPGETWTEEVEQYIKQRHEFSPGSLSIEAEHDDFEAFDEVEIVD